MNPTPHEPPEAQDHTWENVLLQISLAFTIILGYVISQNTSRVRSLEGQLEVSAEVVRKLKTTPAGEFAVGQVRAQREGQRVQLLAEWWRLRPERPLYRALVRLRDVDRIHLDEQSLPQDATFAALLTEQRRVFPGPQGEVSADEVLTLLTAVCRRAGYLKDQPEKRMTELRDAARQEVLRDVLFDPHWPDPDNLKAVAHAIRQDLLDERGELRALQHLLVARISLARLGTSPGADGSGNPAEVMRQFLAEVRGPLGLFSEVEKNLLNAG